MLITAIAITLRFDISVSVKEGEIKLASSLQVLLSLSSSEKRGKEVIFFFVLNSKNEYTDN